METQSITETPETTTPDTTTVAVPESLGSWPDAWYFPYFES